MNTNRILTLLATCSLPFALSPALFAQGGPLTPPGAPAVTLKSLAEIDPGTPINPADVPATGITISTPGYYYLTGNITNVPATERPILINASNVTLDLRGFAIIASGGVGTGPSDSAIRISSADSATVRNGSIVGAFYAGAYALGGDNCTFENLRVEGTTSSSLFCYANALVLNCQSDGCGTGPRVGLGSLIKNCTTQNCISWGFSADDRSTIVDCVARNNGTDGFRADPSCVISGCVAAENDGDGFNFSSSALVDRCHAYDNGGFGFESTSNSSFTSCMALFNGDDGFRTTNATRFWNCTSYFSGQFASSAADGFEMGTTCAIVNSTSYDNDGVGIRCTNNINHIEGNLIFSNDSGGISLISNNSAVIRNYIRPHGFFTINQSGGGVAPIQSPSTATNPFANLQ